MMCIFLVARKIGSKPKTRTESRLQSSCRSFTSVLQGLKAVENYLYALA